MIDELADVITEYSKLLEQLDIVPDPEDFILQDVIEAKNKGPFAAQPKPAAESPAGDVTGPAAESDRGTKKPAPEKESDPLLRSRERRVGPIGGGTPPRMRARCAASRRVV